MTILDFREIAKPFKATKEEYGGHLDNFEKFAQEFFRELYNARLIEVATRGADRGRDLLLEVTIEGIHKKWLVSCKHTAHTGNAVGAIEKNISDRFASSGADVFVCFYSHIATASLQETLNNLKLHSKNFDFIIFNSARIETELLSSQNGKGWFLAARHFPSSFTRLFQNFLHPISHYKESDVHDNSNGRLELPGPGGGIVSYNNQAERQSGINYLVEHANESVTFILNEAFFAQVLFDITQQWPTCFSYWEACPIDEIRTSDIFPTFDTAAVVELFYEAPGLALVACFFWTWWDEQRAIDVYQDAYAQALGSTISEANARTNLGVRMALIHCPMSLRDKITRFVAFAKPSLRELSTWEKLSRTAHFNNREPELREILLNIYQKAITNASQCRVKAHPDCATLDQLNDYSYVLGHNHVHKELERFIGELHGFNYIPLKKLENGGMTWRIKPSENYEWLADKITSR